MPVAALLLTTCVGAISDRTGFRLTWCWWVMDGWSGGRTTSS